MSLTNCYQCKYFDRSPNHSGDIICSLNPAYATMWKHLSQLDEYSKGCLPIDDCREFEFEPSLEEKTIALNLSLDDWRRFVRESASSSVMEALNNNLFSLEITLTQRQWQDLANSTKIPNLKLTLANCGIKPQLLDNGNWIEIESSCIDAIAFDEATSILKIRFHSGSVYEYYDFDRFKFSDFRNAVSHGRYFHSEIRDVYQYQPV